MEGIDVSVYQGDINWVTVKSLNNLDFAYIKMSQGINSRDPKCMQNAAGIASSTLKFGYYHFATLNMQDVFTDAKQEANDVLLQLKQLPKPNLAIALDIELNDVWKLTPSQVENWIHTFINTMAAAGYQVILYSYKPFLDANLPNNHTLGQYPLWLAQYSHNEFPSLPHGWTQWCIWQFSSTGKVNGITGNVDMNHARILI